MGIERNSLLVLLAVGLILTICGCVGAAEESPDPVNENGVAITVSLRQEDGTALCATTIHLSMGGTAQNMLWII